MGRTPVNVPTWLHETGKKSMRILRTNDVLATTGLSRTTIWRLERDRQFPRRIRLGANSVGWVAQEVEEWLKHRPRID